MKDCQLPQSPEKWLVLFLKSANVCCFDFGRWKSSSFKALSILQIDVDH